MEEIFDFDECIMNSSKKKHLILGNGFSVDLFPNIFNYKNLSEKIVDPKIKAIFGEFETCDFEFVISKLAESLRVINHYDVNKEIYNIVKSDVEKLKEILITVISQSHPENPTYITDYQYKSCYEFLKHFEEGKKYTFNYDLILYWVYMHFLEHDDFPLKTDDGFRSDVDDNSMVTWDIGREHFQNLYYIHGAMHIFNDENAVIQKYTWRNGNKTIAQQVKDSIELNKLPMFITEGTSDHKLKRIKENGYLSRSFSSMKSISDDVFIFGHSIRDEDNHVFNIMNSNSKLKKVFISLFGDKSSESNKKIIQKIDFWRKEYKISKREYLFYNAETANIWKRFDNIEN